MRVFDSVKMRPNFPLKFADFDPLSLVHHLEQVDQAKARERRDQFQQALLEKGFSPPSIRHWTEVVESLVSTKPDFAFENNYYWRQIKQMLERGRPRKILEAVSERFTSF